MKLGKPTKRTVVSLVVAAALLVTGGAGTAAAYADGTWTPASHLTLVPVYDSGDCQVVGAQPTQISVDESLASGESIDQIKIDGVLQPGDAEIRKDIGTYSYSYVVTNLNSTTDPQESVTVQGGTFTVVGCTPTASITGLNGTPHDGTTRSIGVSGTVNLSDIPVGATVTVKTTAGGVTTTETVSSSGGTFNTTLTGSFPDGSVPVTSQVYVNGVATGSSASTSVTFTAPKPPDPSATLTPITVTPHDDGTTRSIGVTGSVTLANIPNGATVTIVTTASNGATTTKTITGSGPWSTTLTGTFPDGDVTVTSQVYLDGKPLGSPSTGQATFTGSNPQPQAPTVGADIHGGLSDDGKTSQVYAVVTVDHGDTEGTIPVTISVGGKVIKSLEFPPGTDDWRGMFDVTTCGENVVFTVAIATPHGDSHNYTVNVPCPASDNNGGSGNGGNGNGSGGGNNGNGGGDSNGTGGNSTGGGSTSGGSTGGTSDTNSSGNDVGNAHTDGFDLQTKSDASLLAQRFSGKVSQVSDASASSARQSFVVSPEAGWIGGSVLAALALVGGVWLIATRRRTTPAGE